MRQGTTSLAEYAEVSRPKIQPTFDGAACLDKFRRFGRTTPESRELNRINGLGDGFEKSRGGLYLGSKGGLVNRTGRIN